MDFNYILATYLAEALEDVGHHPRVIQISESSWAIWMSAFDHIDVANGTANCCRSTELCNNNEFWEEAIIEFSDPELVDKVCQFYESRI